MSNSQFGFKNGYSTYMVLTILTDNITSAIDKRRHIIGLFLDFHKTFDTVNHDILLRNLDHCGIRGIALQWFQSYLYGKQQTVNINGINSVLRKITTRINIRTFTISCI